MSQPTVTIREGTSDDCQTIANFLEALAKHDNHDTVMNNVEELRRDGFEEQWYHTFIAETEDDEGLVKAVGLALYSYSFSMLVGRAVHLEALFVDDSCRGQGLGTKLLKEVAKIAQSKNCKSIYIYTLASNPQALGMYTSKGAVDVTEARQVHLLCMREAQMTELANS